MQKTTRKVLNIKANDKIIFQGVTIDVTAVTNKRAKIMITAERQVAYVYVSGQVDADSACQPRS